LKNRNENDQRKYQHRFI